MRKIIIIEIIKIIGLSAWLISATQNHFGPSAHLELHHIIGTTDSPSD